MKSDQLDTILSSVNDAEKSNWIALLASLYGVRLLRGPIRHWLKRLEGGEMKSSTLRYLIEKFHGVRIGRYSYGPCFTPGVLPYGSIVGSYCSIADGLTVFLRQCTAVKDLRGHVPSYRSNSRLSAPD